MSGALTAAHSTAAALVRAARSAAAALASAAAARPALAALASSVAVHNSGRCDASDNPDGSSDAPEKHPQAAPSLGYTTASATRAQ
eukprot:3749494-Prymnesium_polylepis.1